MEIPDISPAPWSAEPPHNSDGFAYIVDAEGRQIALTSATNGWPVPPGNAPLLASAPELAEALEAGTLPVDSTLPVSSARRKRPLAMQVQLDLSAFWQWRKGLA